MNNSPDVHFKVGFGFLFLIILTTGIGWSDSPRVNGRPILLLPEVKAVEDYRRQAITWDQQLTLLDGDINSVISSNPSDLFGQSQQVQSTFERSLGIAQAIDRQAAPPALVGLKDQLTAISGDYLDATRLALRWISTSDPNNLNQIQIKLSTGRSELKTLEGSQWLVMK